MKQDLAGPALSAENLSVVYADRRVLHIPALSVNVSQVTGIIGPNGSGKTTLLLCLALLLKPTTGSISFGGKIVSGGTPARHTRRRFAVVFQEPLLLNTTVWENVAMGMRLRGLAKSEIDKRAAHWLERFGIGALASRNARTLSGGEAQRTSLARAFVLEPEVLFLDEPFAALDAPTRQSLFGDMINILKETRFTTVLVTHDRNEAQTLADQIVMLLNGRIAQQGSPREVFSTPASEEIARFVGMENILEGTVKTSRDCIVDIGVADQVIEGVSSCQSGSTVRVFIRPEDVTVSLSRPSGSARNVFAGRIISFIPAGPLVRLNLECGFPLIALITRMSFDELKLEVGKPLFASFKATAIHVIAVK
jgi:molybdopterin-binding protein